MKAFYKIIPIVIITGFLLFSASNVNFCLAQNPGDEQNTVEPPPEQIDITNEQADEILNELKKSDMPRFERLRNLRKDEPEKFRHELRSFASRRGQPGRVERPQGPPRPEGEPPDFHFIHRQQGEFTSWLQKNYPQHAEDVNKLKDKDQRLYRESLFLAWQKYRRIFEVSQTNPQLANILKQDLELITERDKLLRKLHMTKDEKEKAEIIKDLETVIDKRFDIIVQKKQIEYEQLQLRLKKLEEEIKQGQAKIENWKKPEIKSKIVKSHIDELIKKDEKFRWD